MSSCIMADSLIIIDLILIFAIGALFYLGRNSLTPEPIRIPKDTLRHK
ncbi:MAG: hypothetical protein H7A23_14215 [Leptospiraceae bacterium]|nr:hypothetical protein [Leptospiraceae bacterium]MCP5495705.1 hypothetical protein [Leptospiraceae bacterium]